MNQLLRHLLWLPDQASTFAPRADRLHYSIFLSAVVIGGICFSCGLYFMIRYRYRGTPITPKVEGPPWLEAIFVGVPLSVFLLWFVIGFHDYLFATQPPKDAIDIYVSAKQWMWKFTYPDGPSSIGTLRVPLHRPVRLLLTSRDVVHSFFVPDFRLKQDAVPGRYTQTWFEATEPGSHPVLCAEYCGLNHSLMRAEVVAMDDVEFQKWLAAQKAGVARTQDSTPPGPDENAELSLVGQKVAAVHGCFKCHSVDGTAHIGPTWLDLYGRTETLTTGEKVIADEAYLTQSMMDPAAKVVQGFKPVMPSFKGQLTPPEAAALLEYIKSLKTGRLGQTRTQEPVYEPRR